MGRKSLLYIFFTVLVASGCSRYAYVSLNYPLAPEAYLPDDVHSIAIVNRSLPGEDQEDAKTMEAILTGEIAGSDRLASDDCIKGVYDAVMGLENTELVIPAALRMAGTGTRELPDMLDWEKVAEICDQEGADALLVLETFDSNTDLLVSAAVDQVASIITTGAPSPAIPGQVKVHVVSYWRLYDPDTSQQLPDFRYPWRNASATCTSRGRLRGRKGLYGTLPARLLPGETGIVPADQRIGQAPVQGRVSLLGSCKLGGCVQHLGGIDEASQTEDRGPGLPQYGSGQ
jgi:hypothetical protein